MSIEILSREAVLAAPEVIASPINVEAERCLSYPLPALQKSGPVGERSVSIVTLQNERVRVSLCPDLGGRVVGWEDLTTGSTHIPLPDSVELSGGGEQGLEWRHGIVWLPYGARLADLGPVNTEVHQGEEGESAGVVLSGASPSGIVLWRIAVALRPGADSLVIEGQVYQAAFHRIQWQSGLRIWNKPALYVNSRQTFRWYEEDGAKAALFPGFDVPARVGFTLKWKAEISPVCEPRTAAAHSGIANAWAEPRLGTIEASMAEATAAFGRDEDLAISADAQFIPGLAGGMWALHAGMAIRNQEWAEAIDCCDRALETDARDHRLWWLRAVAARKLGLEAEGPSLPNAHFLWPSDPLLRAEALLSSPVPEGRDAHPLLKAFQGDPSAMVDVAAQLCLYHLDTDLSRWVDECCRVQEVPALRYLLAYALLTRSRFEMQAAEYVILAARQPLAPPFPSRAIEKTALTALAKRFPNDKRLPLLLNLYDWGHARW